MYAWADVSLIELTTRIERIENSASLGAMLTARALDDLY